MSKVQRTAWKCDYLNCGHEWLATSEKPPEKCAKCRRRIWNHVKPVEIVEVEPMPKRPKSMMKRIPKAIQKALKKTPAVDVDQIHSDLGLLKSKTAFVPVILGVPGIHAETMTSAVQVFDEPKNETAAPKPTKRPESKKVYEWP